MSGGGFIGPVMGLAGAAVGIGVVGMGANLLYNETQQIIPNAKKTLRERG